MQAAYLYFVAFGPPPNLSIYPAYRGWNLADGLSKAMTKSTELEALVKFLKEAQQDLAKKDIEGAQISVKHALGRAKNLKSLFDEDFYILSGKEP